MRKVGEEAQKNTERLLLIFYYFPDERKGEAPPGDL